jgi:hypothetical protein
MTIAGYVPYFTIYSNAGTISLASEGIIAIPASVIPPEPEPGPPLGPSYGYVGRPSGASRGRMTRRRKHDELEIEERTLHPVDLPPPAPGPSPPDLKPPPPGLTAGMPIRIAQLPPSAPLDEDEEEIALLLELLS